MSIPRWNPCLTLSAKESKLLARHKTSRSSSAQESHLHALTEPYLNLSAHTALHVLAISIGAYIPSFQSASRSGRLRDRRPR